MKALISKSPHIENILSGKKTWEIRGCNTKTRGEIALIQSGTGTVVGKCNIVKVLGPITLQDLQKNSDKHCVSQADIERVLGKYKKIYAWVLNDPIKLPTPIKYQHPKGAIIWVDLKIQFE